MIIAITMLLLQSLIGVFEFIKQRGIVLRSLVILNRPKPLELLSRRDIVAQDECHNRNHHGLCHINATNDLEALNNWLDEFSDSPETWRNYRKEAERLLLWSTITLNKSLSSLTRDDFRAYQSFIANPTPTDIWCGPRATRHSPEWKPFQGPLKASSQKQAMIVINALLSYLVQAGYLHGNPLSLIRRRSQTIKDESNNAIAIERFLDTQTWEYLKGYIRQLPQRTAPQRARYERIRFLFHFLYLLAPRVSEVCSHTMNSFREYRGKWWWFAVGKGNKFAKVPINNEMLDALARYRQFLGLSHLPEIDDATPLLRSVSEQRSVTSSTVYRLVKSVVQGAADAWERENPQKAAKLRRASTHWFRHTSITHQDDAGVALKYLNRNARHSKLETTAIYQHAEDDNWHDETQKHAY